MSAMIYLLSQFLDNLEMLSEIGNQVERFDFLDPVSLNSAALGIATELTHGEKPMILPAPMTKEELSARVSEIDAYYASNLRSDEDCQNLADRGSVPRIYGFFCPNIYQVNGKNLYICTINNIKFRLLVMEYINGKDFFTLNELPTLDDLKKIAEETAKLNQIDFRPPFIYDRWAIINFEKEYKNNIKYIKGEYKELIDSVYDEFKTIDLSKLKYGYVHGDLIETNVMRDENKKLWFIDFSVANYFPRIIDLAVTICDLCLDLDNIQNTIIRTKTYLNSYESLYPLSDYERQCLKIILKCHQAITILETTREKIEENNCSDENQRFLEKGKKGLKIVFEKDIIKGEK